jgi:two-component system, sensor histidine kinase
VPIELLTKPMTDDNLVSGPEILVVDDRPANLTAIEAALGDFGGRVARATSGREALRHLSSGDVAVILLDVRMPELDGFETAKLIRSRPRSQHVPIIFVTAYGRADEDMLRGYALGAVDFLFKPIVPEILRAKVGVFVELQRRAAELRRQAELLREMERRDMERRLVVERQQWESEALRGENKGKDEFMAILAHELRNPLAPIVTGLELIREYGIEHEGLTRVRDSMERQVSHLRRLVDDLLDVSRISVGKISLKKERVAVGELVRQAVESVQRLIEGNRHELTLDASDSEVEVEVDPVRIVQVVSNLLTNAARYTDPGGSIRVSCARQAGDAVVRVADNGRGIAPEFMDRIFDTFVQGEGDGGGLGLGLTLVRKLVELHGGKVRAFSKGLRQGSEFIVTLPLASQAPGSRRKSAYDEPQATSSESLRIVLLDDATDARTSLQMLLEAWGYEVVSAADGNRGLEVILEQRPDVALIDIAMPGMDGYDVARRVREVLPRSVTKLIALTGFGTTEDLETASEAGFDAHLTKPASSEALRNALRSDR